jgi:hypothetical protein
MSKHFMKKLTFTKGHRHLVPKIAPVQSKSSGRFRVQNLRLELRRELRKAVIKRVSSGFTEYLEHNDISTSRVTPQELNHMLQELLEG